MPKELIIKPKDYSSFVVYEITKSPQMDTRIFYISDDFVNSKFSMIASFAGFITMLVIIIYEFCVNKNTRYTLVLNVLILTLVFLVSMEKEFHIGLHDYELPSVLFFVLCLLKVDASRFICLSAMGSLLAASYFES